MKQGLTFCLLLIFSQLLYAQDEEILDIDSTNIQSVRNEITHAVYGNEVIPRFKLLTKPDRKFVQSSTYPTNSIGKIEVGMVEMKYGFTSKIYIIHPVEDNGLNVPIIYHSGHGFGVFGEDVEVNFNDDTVIGRLSINHFLSKGFTVVAIAMPFFGENRWPLQVTENNLKVPMHGHNDLFYLENPFYYFMAPVRSVIDYLQENRNYDEFVMYGLSGGGWTTTVYSAMDTRIRLSFPVAGSIPIPLRVAARDFGDAEQYYAPFYDRFNYSTLYFLGAAGERRKQYQILIKKDHCCFAFDGSLYWEGKVKKALEDSGLPGSYEFFYDTVSTTHRISALAVDSMQYHIIADMIIEKLNEMFSLTSSRESNTICENDTIELYLSKTGVNRVEWYLDGDKIDTAISYNIKVGQEGTYHAVVRNLSGGVVLTRNIEIKRQNIFSKPVISRNGDKLYSSYASGNSWYLNGKLISNQNSNFLLLSQPGRYTLRVSQSPCTSDFSEPYDFGIVAFPNPSLSQVMVRLPRDLQTVSFSFRSMQGSEVLKGQFVGETIIRYNASVKPGVYFIHLKNSSGFKNVQKILVGN